jgi:signal transduction histidine kinase
MGRRVEDKDQRLEPVLPGPIGPLRADRDLIRRVLENLIDNAYKYGPRHTTINIEILPATMDDGAERAVEIRVRDEGEGVPAPYRQLIFEKYGRVEGRTGAAARGSHGLGLVFCRRAVGVHGGAIWVEDGAGRGGCFCVRLPIARLPLSEAAGPPLGAPRGGLAV